MCCSTQECTSEQCCECPPASILTPRWICGALASHFTTWPRDTCPSSLTGDAATKKPCMLSMVTASVHQEGTIWVEHCYCCWLGTRQYVGWVLLLLLTCPSSPTGDATTKKPCMLSMVTASVHQEGTIWVEHCHCCWLGTRQHVGWVLLLLLVLDNSACRLRIVTASGSGQSNK